MTKLSGKGRMKPVKAWALVFRDFDKSFFDIEEIWMEKPKKPVFTNKQYELIEVEIRQSTKTQSKRSG